jgi:SAM-dependent methyltransferase
VTADEGQAPASGAVPPAAAGGAQAMSFGTVAASYDKVRPGPAPAAVDWLVPPGCGLAVDLAAGTGLFTRALLGRAARVVAVEPDARMREVLARHTPGAEVLAGAGEDLPLPDACADAVFVSTAWHWLDLDRAVPEIARVLRPGGRLGVLWTSRDRQEDWVAELDLVRLGDTEGSRPRTPATVRAWLDRQHTVDLPAGSPFGAGHAASFGYRRVMAVADVMEWLATNSAFITAPPDVQADSTARCHAALLRRSVPGPAGTPAVAMPVRSWCWRATRRLRPGPVITKTDH